MVTARRSSQGASRLASGSPGGAPTGAAFNGVSTDFNGDNFLFDSEAGIISGWRGAFTLTGTAEVGNGDRAGDAVYKGLAIGTADVGDGAQQYLYATDFHNGQIDVLDRTFAFQTWTGAFHDPKLPKGYAPFGIANLNGMLFVTYAKTAKWQRRRASRHGTRCRRLLRDRRDVPRPGRDAMANSTPRGAWPGRRPISAGSATT